MERTAPTSTPASIVRRHGLMVTALDGHLDVVQYLVGRLGADVNHSGANAALMMVQHGKIVSTY
jgi:hypothetical protein